MRISLLGVPVDAIDRNEARAKIRCYLREKSAHLVTTPNPEMVVASRHDLAFKHALGQADLAIPDSFGLRLGAWLSGQYIPEKIPGADFLLDILEIAVEKGSGVYFLGGSEGIAAAAVNNLRVQFPTLKCVGANDGGRVFIDIGGSVRIDTKVMENIERAAPAIIFVAFGHGKQERWIVDNITKLPSIKIAMGVGGAFDFFAGKVRRAPKLMRGLGLEWLWRLILEPRRIGRIWNAVVVFPWLIMTRRRDKK